MALLVTYHHPSHCNVDELLYNYLCCVDLTTEPVQVVSFVVAIHLTVVLLYFDLIQTTGQVSQYLAQNESELMAGVNLTLQNQNDKVCFGS